MIWPAKQRQRHPLLSTIKSSSRCYAQYVRENCLLGWSMHSMGK